MAKNVIIAIMPVLLVKIITKIAWLVKKDGN